MGMKALLLVSFALSVMVTVVTASFGNAVFHTYKTPSACFKSQDKGPWITGVNDALWNNGALCGKFFKVTCIGGANLAPHPCKGHRSVTVQVTDKCDRCTGDLNLSQEAFSAIADTKAGKVRVRYDPL